MIFFVSLTFPAVSARIGTVQHLLLLPINSFFGGHAYVFP